MWAHQVCYEEEEDKSQGGVGEECPFREAVEAVVFQDTHVVVNLQVAALVLVYHGRPPAIPQPVDVPKPAHAPCTVSHCRCKHKTKEPISVHACSILQGCRKWAQTNLDRLAKDGISRTPLGACHAVCAHLYHRLICVDEESSKQIQFSLYR